MSYHHAQLENAASKQSQPTTITSPVMTTKSLHGYLAASRWAPEVSPPTVASLLACQGGIASSRFAAEDAPVTDKKAATQPKSTKGKGKKRNAPKPTTPAPKLTPAPVSNVKATKSAARKQKPAKAASAPKPAPSAATFDATLSLIADQIEVAKAAQPHTPMPPYSWPQEEEQVFSTTAEDINLFEADLNPEPPVYIPAAFTEQESAIRVLLDDPNFNISDWIEDIEMPSLDPTAAEFEPVQTAPTPQMPSPSAAWSHNLMCDTADHLEANKGAELPIPSPAVAWAEAPVFTPSDRLKPEKLSWADEVNQHEHTPALNIVSPGKAAAAASAFATARECERKLRRRAILTNVLPAISRN